MPHIQDSGNTTHSRVRRPNLRYIWCAYTSQSPPPEVVIEETPTLTYLSENIPLNGMPRSCPRKLREPTDVRRHLFSSQVTLNWDKSRSAHAELSSTGAIFIHFILSRKPYHKFINIILTALPRPFQSHTLLFSFFRHFSIFFNFPRFASFLKNNLNFFLLKLNCIFSRCG